MEEQENREGHVEVDVNVTNNQWHDSSMEMGSSGSNMQSEFLVR